MNEQDNKPEPIEFNEECLDNPHDLGLHGLGVKDTSRSTAYQTTSEQTALGDLTFNEHYYQVVVDGQPVGTKPYPSRVLAEQCIQGLDEHQRLSARIVPCDSTGRPVLLG